MPIPSVVDGVIDDTSLVIELTLAIDLRNIEMPVSFTRPVDFAITSLN